MSGNKHTLIAVAGPTAAGKTAFAIQLARHFNTSILSFDSRQCYRELRIGVARPTAEELAAVQHYFIASHSIHQPVDAAGFEAYGLEILQQGFARQNIMVAVGGTGLYLKALTEGLDTMPDIPESIRQDIRSSYAEKGIHWLWQQVAQEDPLFAASGEMQNPQRMMRALEVVRASGLSIKKWQNRQATSRDFRVIKAGLQLPRAALNSRIEQRVEAMIAEGLVEEARALYPFRNVQALQTVGYRECFSYFDGEMTKAAMMESIKTHTRQYAKRQMTWFRKDPDIIWGSPETGSRLMDEIQEALDR